jgi:hypothetical protein
MPAAEFTIKRVRLRLRTLYTCSRCGAKEAGEGADVEFDGLYHTPEQLAEHLKKQPIHNSNMPMSWAGYGLTDHRCPKCQT